MVGAGLGAGGGTSNDPRALSRPVHDIHDNTTIDNTTVGQRPRRAEPAGALRHRHRRRHLRAGGGAGGMFLLLLPGIGFGVSTPAADNNESSDSESPNATILFTITFVLPPAVADPLNLKAVPLISAVNVSRLLLPEKTSLYDVMYALVLSCVTSASMLLVSPVD